MVFHINVFRQNLLKTNTFDFKRYADIKQIKHKPNTEVKANQPSA